MLSDLHAHVKTVAWLFRAQKVVMLNPERFYQDLLAAQRFSVASPQESGPKSRAHAGGSLGPLCY